MCEFMIDKKKEYAIVTGGSSGVGREYALQLAAKGYNILLVSDDDINNQKVAQEIKQAHLVDANALTLDLCDSSSIRAITDFVDHHSLSIEVLICNAGILLFGGVTSTTQYSFERIIDLHCKATTLLCREFAIRMSQVEKGYILIMSSSSAWMPYPTIAAYSATKAYLKNFGRSLYYELRDQGIKVTTIFPGAIDTRLFSLNKNIRSRLLWWRVMSTPQYIAEQALHSLFKGKHCSKPGLFNKSSTTICAILPSWALLPVLKIKRLRKLW